MLINEITKAHVFFPKDWILAYYELYNIDPGEVANIEGIENPAIIWNQFFSQDLLQLKNPGKGLFIDIGWHPHADPSGFYRLIMFKYIPCLEGEHQEVYHWDMQIKDYQTRNIDDLIKNLIALSSSV